MSQQQPQWLKDFLRWLRGALGLEADRPRIKILDEYHADGISVFNIEDPTIPGCVTLWRIDKHHEGYKFFLCVISIATLREELGLLGIRREDLLKSRGGGMANNLFQQLKDEDRILATHYWITGWNEPISAIDRKGRRYKSSRTVDVQLLACDLQGIGAAYAGNKYADRFALKIIQQLAANEFREWAYHRTWRAAVKSIDWEKWLTGLAQHPKNGIATDHVLRPLKPGRKKPKVN